MNTATTYTKFATGSTVCLIDYANACEVHYGTVTSVKVERNGYPTTTVNFPTFRGERVYAVELLIAPEAVEAAIFQRQSALSAFGWS